MNWNCHASSISWQGKGVLIFGASKSGKSDLTLRMIFDKQAQLIADDRTIISAENGKIYASAPENIRGLLEIRGLGIKKLDAVEKASIELVVELVASPEETERYPEPDYWQYEDIQLPRIKLYPFEVSATNKIIAALTL